MCDVTQTICARIVETLNVSTVFNIPDRIHESANNTLQTGNVSFRHRNQQKKSKPSRPTARACPMCEPRYTDFTRSAKALWGSSCSNVRRVDHTPTGRDVDDHPWLPCVSWQFVPCPGYSYILLFCCDDWVSKLARFSVARICFAD